MILFRREVGRAVGFRVHPVQAGLVWGQVGVGILRK